MNSAFPDLSQKILNRQNIPSGMNVLVMAPHPDDFDIIAVTLKLLEQRGNKIILAVMGSSWKDVADGFYDASTPEMKKKVRADELMSCCALFGLPVENINLLYLKEDSSGDIKNTPNNHEAVGAVIKAAQPHLIFMPHWNDSNYDHRLGATMVWEILEELKLTIPVLHYFTPHTRTMYRQLYTVFTAEEAAWKASLLGCHKSQAGCYLRKCGCSFVDRIIQMNLELGRDIKKGDYAEAFEVKIITVASKSPLSSMKF